MRQVKPPLSQTGLLVKRDATRSISVREALSGPLKKNRAIAVFEDGDLSRLQNQGQADIETRAMYNLNLALKDIPDDEPFGIH